MKKLKLVLTLLILCSLVFNFTDEDLPPPYHKFRITGKIICDTLADKSSYTVTLYGKSEFTYNKYQKAFRYPDGIENFALTDSSGNYLLIATNEFEFDSIKTAVILPGKEPIFSEAVYVDKSNRIEIKKYIDGYKRIPEKTNYIAQLEQVQFETLDKEF